MQHRLVIPHEGQEVMWIIRVKRVKVQVWNGGNKLPTPTIESFGEGRGGGGERKEKYVHRKIWYH